MKKMLSVCLVVAVFFSIFPIAFAQEEQNYKIYVYQTGNDDASGTKEHPVATIQKAQELARELSGKGNVDVIIGDGTYFQNETIRFDRRDSGTNGFKVRYIADEGAHPIISGGKLVSGWKQADDGSWYTSVDTPEIIREFYVNGTKCKLARTNQKVAGIGFGTEKGSPYVHDGIVFDKSVLDGVEHPEDITMHWSIAWMCYVLKCRGVVPYGSDKLLAKVQQPIFDSLSTREANPISGVNSFYLENAKIFMDEPGEFYYDAHAKILHYIPREGEDMTTAQAIVPVLEKIVEVKGADMQDKVKNLEFHGLTFAHGAWFLPAQYGYNAVQAQWITIEDYEVIFTPANVTVDFAENVSFYGNTFTGLGCVGLGINEGVENISVVGNTFYDIKDSAMSVGLITHEYIDEADAYYNVAKEKPISASSYSIRRYSAEKAVDSMDETGWRPNSDDAEPWIQLDLEKEYDVAGVEILFEKGAAKNGKIYLSNDKNFSNKKQLTLNKKDNTTITASFNMGTMPGVEYTYNGAEGTYRYLRIYTEIDSQINRIKVFDKSRAGVQQEGIVKNSLISSNYITRVADYFWSSPALVGYYTENVEVSNNHIENVPYSGISWGWGWIYATASTTAKNNKISHNYLQDLMQECYDGGAIYTLGQQPGSEIFENYVRRSRLPYGTIYLDGGSSGFTVTNNVTEDIGRYFENNPAEGSNKVFHNFTTTTSFRAGNPKTEVTDTIGFAKYMPTAEIHSIMNKSGLLPAWQYVKKNTPSAPKDYDAFGEEGYINITDTAGGTGINAYFLAYEINFADTALKLLDSGKLRYKFAKEDIEKYRDEVYRVKGLMSDSNVTSAKTLYTAWEDLIEAYEVLFDSREKVSYDELLAKAEKELQTAIEGNTYNTYSQKAIDDFSEFLRTKDNYQKANDAYLDLEQAYNAFCESKNTLEITDVSCNTLMGNPEIDNITNTVTVYVSQNTELDKLLLEYTLSPDCHLSDQTKEIIDYTEPVTIVVKNETETSYRFWTVKVVKKASSSFN